MKLNMLVLALALSFFCACSSPRYQTRERVTDLGIVKTADRETHLFPVSGGEDCRMTFTTLANGNVLVEAVVFRKDAKGNLKIIARPQAETRFGQKVSIPVSDGSILLIPVRI